MNAKAIALTALLLSTNAYTQNNDHPNGDCKSVVSDALTNPIMTRLRQQYLELVNREAEFSVRYGKDHAAVVNLRHQICDIRNSVLNELRRLAENVNCPIDIDKYSFPKYSFPDCLGRK